MFRILTLSGLLLAILAAGCAEVPIADCTSPSNGIRVRVTIDESSTPDGQTAPPSLSTPILLFKAINGRELVADTSTDKAGCIIINPTSPALEPGHYELEASINRGACDWFDYRAFDYDGRSADIQLKLTCQIVN